MARIHEDVKTGTYEGLKWEVSESEFCLKLPDKRAASAAIRFFNSRHPSMAIYMTRTGSTTGWQWRLGKREYRTIWTDVKVKEVE